MWNCDTLKAYSNGINIGFIKLFWEEIKFDIMRFILEFDRNGKLVKGLNLYVYSSNS